MRNLLVNEVHLYSKAACQAVEERIVKDCKESGFDLVGTLDEFGKQLFSFSYNGVEDILVPVEKDGRRYFIVYQLAIKDGDLTSMVLAGIRSIPRKSLDDILNVVDGMRNQCAVDVRNAIRLNTDEKRYQVSHTSEETLNFYGNTEVVERFWIKDPENQGTLLISFKDCGRDPVKKLSVRIIHPKEIPMGDMTDQLFALTVSNGDVARIYESESDFRTALIDVLESSTLEYLISDPDETFGSEIVVTYADKESTDELDFTCHYCCFATEDEEKIFIEYSCD